MSSFTVHVYTGFIFNYFFFKAEISRPLRLDPPASSYQPYDKYDVIYINRVSSFAVVSFTLQSTLKGLTPGQTPDVREKLYRALFNLSKMN